MDAVEFLKRNQHALTNGDLVSRTSLYSALGGGYKDASTVPVANWPIALQSAAADWFDQWPEPISRLTIDPNTFFSGQTMPSKHGSTYTVYRLFRPNWVVPDSTAPPDIEAENLKLMVRDHLNLRPIIFVTDWADLAATDTCVASCMEALGLGGQQINAHEKRIAVGLSVQGSLHKSTWIDSDFWIYWMPNLQPNEAWGYARHLVTGAHGAKEWVCRPTETVVVLANVITAQRSLDSRLDKMSDAYWEACRDWVLAYRQGLLTAP